MTPPPLLLLLLVSFFAHQARAADSHQVNSSSTKLIDEHGVCAAVTNNHVSGQMLFVPSRLATEWTTFRGNPPTGVSIGGCSPNSFSFVDLTDQPTSTLIISNVVQISGITGSLPTSISGQGSPRYRICSNVTCTSVVQSWTNAPSTIDNGRYLQLRLTSAGTIGTLLSATVTVGTGSDQWDVTTVPYLDCPGSPGAGDIGCRAADGSFFAGYTPDGGTRMFISATNEGGHSYGGYGTFHGGLGGNTGESNTTALVGYGGHPGAQTCWDSTDHGKTDWYLPGQNEILVWYNAGDPIYGLSNTYYLSSTEQDANNARTANPVTGVDNNTQKNSGRQVRCARKE